MWVRGRSNSGSLKVGSPEKQSDSGEFVTTEQPTLQRRSSQDMYTVGKDPKAEFLVGKSTYMNNLGRDFYDNVADAKKEPSVWEQVNKANKAPHPDKLED